MADLHPEVEALFKTSPTCSHGNYCEADVRRIALRAVELEREECAKVCESMLYEADEDFLEKRGDEERVPYEVEQATIRGCAAAIRFRGKP